MSTHLIRAVIRAGVTAVVLTLTTQAAAQAVFPPPVEADFVARDVTFASGERLPEVRLHYRTVGTPRKDADGVVRNGVLILHGTGGSGAGFLSADLRRPAVRQGSAARRRALLHHPARQRRPRPVEQAQRRPADEVPGLPLHRHGPAAASAGDRGPRPHPSAPCHGHVDGGDAQLDVGLHVPHLRRRAGPAGQQPRGDRRAQPHVAQGPGRRHRHRSDLEGRQLHRAAARHGQRPRLPADRDQHAAAVAEAVADGRGGRSAGWPSRSRHD